MVNSEKKIIIEIIIGICITVVGGFILFLISQLFLIDYIYGILVLIIFLLSILVTTLLYYLYKEKEVKKELSEKKVKNEVSKKKKPLVSGAKGKDKDDWLWEC